MEPERECQESNSDDENSDGALQIVIDSPTPKKKTRPELDENAKMAIACVEKDLEETLDEKAARANLTAKHVKNILRHVVTNEDVLALVRHAENPEENRPVTVYEPKYTRAKAKELFSSTPHPGIMPWAPPPPSTSEVHMLFSEDFQEDSSGDEYVPEPPKQASSKEPELTPGKSKEDANIALRTRSKLCLSHTPLEEIEGSFIPPDITTDMYDMDCDDDDWREFLKTFTKPLDEVVKAEDEDQDPEYNILADEEIDEVDKEELRADRAVTVSRKEVNALIAELFEYQDMYESSQLHDRTVVPEAAPPESSETAEKAEAVVATSDSDSENDPDIAIKKCQIPILAQQMRQHVQMLTHNFLLTFGHPEFGDMAAKFKECLVSLKTAAEGNTASMFYAINLEPALRLVEHWELWFSTRSKEVDDFKLHVERVIVESINARNAGVDYVVTFPPKFMETVSKSEVFIYPHFLPRIPFKSLSAVQNKVYFFTNSENMLIAMYLELLTVLLKQDKFHLAKSDSSRVILDHVYYYIHTHVMTTVTQKKIGKHVRTRKRADSEDNPIKYFFRHKKAPPCTHYVMPLDPKNLQPPCKVKPERLPHLWREYLHPPNEQPLNGKPQGGPYSYLQPIIVSPFKFYPISNKATKPPVYNINFAKKIVENRKVQVLKPKGPLPLLYEKRRRGPNVRKARRNLRIELLTDNGVVEMMLPDMPSLGETPVKNQNAQAGGGSPQELSFENVVYDMPSLGFTPIRIQSGAPQDVEMKQEAGQDVQVGGEAPPAEKTASVSSEPQLTFENIKSFDCQFYKPEATKDNPEDIHEFMVASSTVKAVAKKPSGAEKKRAKLRREFTQNLKMATPEGPEVDKQKNDDFASAYLGKLKSVLDAGEYSRMLTVLTKHDERRGQFKDLYKKVQSILSPKYPELSEEFLLFLTEIQAHSVDKLMPYFVIRDMDRFMRKLQLYFKDQPSQIRKILKCMSDLAESPDLKMEDVKGSVLPLLKGNAALTDWFLQTFASERPPKLLSDGPNEVMDITKELARPLDEELYETVIVPDMEDPYGGPNCKCTCHGTESALYQSRSQHCNRCGLKFIQGKVFIQTSKMLRPAVVSFITNPEKDHTERLSATQRKRADASPNKPTTSPNKDAHDEHRPSNESEDDVDGTKKKRKRKVKHRDKASTVKDRGKAPGKDAAASKVCDKSTTKAAKVQRKKTVRKRRGASAKKVAGSHKPGSSAGQQKRPAEEPLEADCSRPIETVKIETVKLETVESGSECFESSQDATNTDSEGSSGQVNASLMRQNGGSEGSSWTREEDKIILQTFQQRTNKEEAFLAISQLLQNRTILQIKNRFKKLMSLLQEMASSSAT